MQNIDWFMTVAKACGMEKEVEDNMNAIDDMVKRQAICNCICPDDCIHKATCERRK